MKNKPDTWRNYICATFDPETAEPICFAVFCMRETKAAAEEAGSVLSGLVYPWMTGRSWVAVTEIMFNQGEGSELLRSTLNTLRREFQWIEWMQDVIPESEGSVPGGNCFASLGEALEAWNMNDYEAPKPIDQAESIN